MQIFIGTDCLPNRDLLAVVTLRALNCGQDQQI